MSDSGRSAASGGLRSLLSRDVLLVALAVLALVVAAFAVPPIDPAAGGGGAGNGTGGGQDGSVNETGKPTETPGQATPSDPPRGQSDAESGGGGSDTKDRTRIEGNGTGDGDGPGLNLTGTRPHPECFVVVWDRLVPGKNVSVFRWHDGGFVADRPVWFEDRRLGRTDETGRVDGRVPYTRELELTSVVGDVEACHVLALEMETGYDEWTQDHGSPRIIVDDSSLERHEPTDGNVTATLPVRGNATLGVQGDPYPGETVRLNATVDGIPMREATVSVDGESVGQTDDRGFYELRIPDDGTDEMTVGVERGDFAAGTTIDVLLLWVDVRPQGLLAVPGGQATVVATVGDSPASGVSISVDGATVARTGEDGQATIDLPADPGSSIRASGYDQSTSVAVWPLYLPTVLVALLGIGLVAGSLGYATRRGSDGATRRVLAVWAGVAVLLVAAVVGGPRAALAVLGIGVILGVLLAAVRYREAVRRWLASAGRLVLATFRAVKQLAIGLADWLGWLADRLLGAVRALAARLRGLPRSIRGVLGVLLAWLARVPERLGAIGRRLVAWVGGWLRAFGAAATTPRGAIALVAATAVIAASYHVFDVEGGLAAAGGLLALWGLWRVVTRGERSPSEGEGGPRVEAGSTGSGTSGATGSGHGRPSLQSLWRTFARWVVPGRWRRQTPGEVARAAVDRGFPEEPVVRLTEAFREVEYGERPASEGRLERAQSAFDALRASRQREEGGDR